MVRSGSRVLACTALLAACYPSRGADLPPPPIHFTHASCVGGGPAKPPKHAYDFDRVSGDFDGDGRQDEFITYLVPNKFSRKYGAHLGSPRARVELATGGFDDASFDGFHLMGVADVNDDKRQEVIVDHGGATVFGASLVTLDRCRIASVESVVGDVSDEAYTRTSDGVFSYYGHGIAGAMGNTVGMQCKDVDGDARTEVAQTSVSTVFPDIDGDGHDTYADFEAAPPNRVTLLWELTGYRLEGTTLREVAHRSGERKASDPPNEPFPFVNGVDCGPVTY